MTRRAKTLNWQSTTTLNSCCQRCVATTATERCRIFSFLKNSSTWHAPKRSVHDAPARLNA
ncbi:MAG: hypothetical protein EB108_04655 [Actinobacteria bacterium]|nr:hypothetical protein [Actinomycetota bacterium]NDA37691.1 hypothetical protein [Acidimicrobiia bacterium]NDB42231.1 hypothetical protein [Actinomycetota bacterium]NDE70542.1 hypothetical protein [Actinomycetota bacterium]NDF88286.1 hypothetical protein [Actinomycetota bacterium]